MIPANRVTGSIVLVAIIFCAVAHPPSFLPILSFAQAATFNYQQYQHASSIPFDPYKILSISRHATADEIQKAYRQKAKETHPDKNPDKDPDNAAEQFRQVTEAYELLSNPHSRKMYDGQVKMREEQRRQAKERERRMQAQKKQREEQLRREKKRKQKEMMENAKKLYDKILKFNGLKQAKSTLLDQDMNYKTNNLIMIVSNKQAEKLGEEEYCFPYPFVLDGGEFGGLIQVAKVRFNSETELTQLYHAKPHTPNPQFIFAKKGDPLHKFHVFQPTRHSINPHSELMAWVQSLLTLQNVKIVNRHSLPIDIMILRGRSSRGNAGNTIFYYEKLEPGYQVSVTAGSKLRPGDRILAYDSRVDSLPGMVRIHEKLRVASNVYLLEEYASLDGVAYVVKSKRCIDLSSQCGDWMKQSKVDSGGKRNTKQCDTIPEFMHGVCPLSCGVCSENALVSGISYYLFHYPTHQLPKAVQGVVKEGRMFVEDVRNIVKLRKNAAAAFFVVGLLLAFNVVVFRAMSDERRKRPLAATDTRSCGSANGIIFTLDLFAVTVAGGLAGSMKWMLSTPARKVPTWLKSFHSDFARISRDSDIFLMILVVGVVASVYLIKFIGAILRREMKGPTLAMYTAILLSLISSILGVLSYMMTSDISRVVRWKHLWKFRKNAAFALAFVGFIGGMGLQSFKRLVRNTPMNTILTMVLTNAIVLGAFWALASLDKHFVKDLQHVINMRKNAAVAFVLIGALAGRLAVNAFEKCLPKSSDPKKVKT